MLKNKWARFLLGFGWCILFVSALEFTEWLYDTGRFAVSKWYLTGIVSFWCFYGGVSVVLEPYMFKARYKKKK